MAFKLPENIKTALLEAGRTVVLSIIPIILLGINTATGEFNINFTLIYATALITLLRFVDKYLHERGKDNENKGYLGEKGITGF